MSPEAYDLHDGRFIQTMEASSAAAGLSAQLPPVPEGKIWTVLAAALWSDIAETRIVHFQIYRGGALFPITIPTSQLYSTAARFPMLTMGMELKLYPREVLRAIRDVATALSYFVLSARIIETDLPFYSYQEPLKKVISGSQRHGSVYRSSGGLSTGGGGVLSGGHGGADGGGGGEPQPY